MSVAPHIRVVYLRHPADPHTKNEIINGIKTYKKKLEQAIASGKIEEVQAFAKKRKILRKRGAPYAVFVSTRLNDGKIVSGWALYDNKTMSHKQTIKIAKGRMLSTHQQKIPIPEIAQAYEAFQIQNATYFDRIKT